MLFKVPLLEKYLINYRWMLHGVLKPLIVYVSKHITNIGNIYVNEDTLWHNVLVLFFRNMFDFNIETLVILEDNNDRVCKLVVNSNLIIIKSLKSMINYVIMQIGKLINVSFFFDTMKLLEYFIVRKRNIGFYFQTGNI